MTRALPEAIPDDHRHDLVLLPVLAGFTVYPAIVARVRRIVDLLDEKQRRDTARAAALSLAAPSMMMFFGFAFSNEGVLTGLVWFPVFMFSVVCWYSAAALSFRRAV